MWGSWALRPPRPGQTWAWQVAKKSCGAQGPRLLLLYPRRTLQELCRPAGFSFHKKERGTSRGPQWCAPRRSSLSIFKTVPTNQSGEHTQPPRAQLPKTTPHPRRPGFSEKWPVSGLGQGTCSRVMRALTQERAGDSDRDGVTRRTSHPLPRLRRLESRLRQGEHHLPNAGPQQL